MSHATYDRIAQWYDVDMARNMRFDDIAFYADFCKREGTVALEVGCGNGRVLLELMARDIDAAGVDISRNMLQQLQRKARIRGLDARACQMDARKLAFGRCFGIVLCPYSLVTYMAQPDDLLRMLSEVRRVLHAGGVAVFDAFIPRDAVAGGDYRLDYRRPWGDGVLMRYKRIAQVAPGINRVERRYEVVSAQGTVVEALDTREDIRTFSPDELTEAIVRSGFLPQEVWWDYGRASREAEPQFFTIAARTTT